MPHGLDVAHIAQGFGLAARRCGDLAAWQDALATPVAANAVQVLVAQFDRGMSEVLHRAHWRHAGQRARAVLAGLP